MKTEYIKVNPSDVSKVPAPLLTEADRRILARSGVPGTELYRDTSGNQSQQARIQLTMAMSGVAGQAVNGEHR